MINVTDMSRMREAVLAPTPSAAIWKASKHILVGDPLFPDRIEAASDAVWVKQDPFRTYRPATEHRYVEGTPSAHVLFLKLADMVRAWNSATRSQQRTTRSTGSTKLLHNATLLFANSYGLLGLVNDTIAAPVLPPRVDGFAWLVPDAVIDRYGKMRVIDTAKGKQLLERALNLVELQTGRKRHLRHNELVFPHELRFPSWRFTPPFGLRPPVFESLGQDMFSWDEVKNLYGVRALLDEDAGMPQVSMIYTREPLEFWHQELGSFRSLPRPPEHLNSKLADVRLHVVRGDDGKTAHSYNCPSLLTALYVMLLLDEEAGVRIQRCQAPGCYEYFRVGPWSRESLYCPPPPGRKQSRCASRASSAFYRERQRKQRKSDTT